MHQSDGKPLRKVELCLGSPVFLHNLLYYQDLTLYTSAPALHIYHVEGVLS